MKTRTAEEISRQIEGLKRMKEDLPEFSHFGDSNWESIDVQLKILEGKKRYEDYEDDEPELERAAYDADEWMNGSRKEDLFEED